MKRTEFPPTIKLSVACLTSMKVKKNKKDKKTKKKEKKQPKTQVNHVGIGYSTET